MTDQSNNQPAPQAQGGGDEATYWRKQYQRVVAQHAKFVEETALAISPSPSPVAQDEGGVPLAWRSCRDGLLAYVLQDDLHNRLTPRVVDVAYSAFMSGRSGKNADDGGPCDWFNDTKPMVVEAIAKMHKDLFDAKPAPQAQGGGDALERLLSDFEHRERGVPQAHMAAKLVAELRAAARALFLQRCFELTGQAAPPSLPSGAAPR